MTEDATASDPVNQRSGGNKVASFFRKNLLLFLMIGALALGIGIGVGIREIDPPLTDRQIIYLRFPGDLLMNMLKMLILPLIISSLIAGMAALDPRSSGWIGGRTIIYYMVTTIMAVILGIILVVTIQPGYKGRKKEEIEPSGKAKVVNTLDTIFDLIRNMFPSNLVMATFSQDVTSQVLDESYDDQWNETENIIWYNRTNTTLPPPTPIYTPVATTEMGRMNILGIVVFSIFFGGVLAYMGEKAKPLIAFFECLNEATMILIHLVIWYSPVGITFLIASKVVEMDDPLAVLAGLGFYMITVLAGLVIHGYIVLPLIYLIAVRKNPFKFIYGILQPIVTAFATASSAATLPVTMECLETNNGIDRRIIRFMAPIGATINMDGTALYEAVASIFIAQLNDKVLTVADIILISLTSTLAAIGAAGVPQAGLVTMVIVLTAVNLPVDDVTLILSIDWFLDRCRTSVNVLGDGLGAGVVGHLSRNDIARMDRQALLDAEEGADKEANSNKGFEETDGQYDKMNNFDTQM